MRGGSGGIVRFRKSKNDDNEPTSKKNFKPSEGKIANSIITEWATFPFG